MFINTLSTIPKIWWVISDIIPYRRPLLMKQSIVNIVTYLKSQSLINNCLLRKESATA